MNQVLIWNIWETLMPGLLAVSFNEKKKLIISNWIEECNHY